MTHEERVAALKRLGFTERESTFLTLTGLHSGYFVPRQYRRFLGQAAGRPEAELARKVLAWGHARKESTAKSGALYHLCSHPFYKLIGEADNRHRRDRARLAVKAKLMGLDFVLDHPEASFLATEREKLAYFHDSRRVDLDLLPSKRYRSRSSAASTDRYFVEKYPILLPAAAGGGDDVVSFTYVDEGALSAAGLRTFLASYARLFERLQQVRLLYVADAPRNFLTATQTVERFLGKLERGQNSKRPANWGQLEEYFDLRQRLEAGQYAGFNKKLLDRLGRYKRTLIGPEIERKFVAYCEDRDASLGEQRMQEERRQALQLEFSTFRLRHNYDIFGTEKQFTRRPRRAHIA